MMLKKIILVMIVILLITYAGVVQAADILYNPPNDGRIYLDENTFYYVVPDDFDPLTASDAELLKYGIPERPDDPEQLSQWKAEVSGAHWVAPQIHVAPGIFHGGPSVILSVEWTDEISQYLECQKRSAQYVAELRSRVVLGLLCSDSSLMNLTLEDQQHSLSQSIKAMAR
jgi:hypothetical protein